METTIVVKLTPDELVPGKVLCDMHNGLSVLEERIPGFVLVNHARIRTEYGKNMVSCLFYEQDPQNPAIRRPSIPGLIICNKLLYLVEDGMLYKAVYYYDYTFFGIVTFKIS
jgi:hypothetical protein